MMFMPSFSPVEEIAGAIMLAGADSGYEGYSDGALLPAFGSITGVLLAGFPLNLLAYSAGEGTEIILSGDAVSQLTGMSLVIDGANYAFADATIPPSTEIVPGFTYARFSIGASFVAAVSYAISIE